MSTPKNAEIYAGSRAQTIAGLFQDEVTSTNPESRNAALNAIHHTSRMADASAGRDLPMLMLNLDAGEFAGKTAAAASKEFDVIRL
jgi:hypothetical protein